MSEYVDLEVLAEADDQYVVLIEKSNFNALVRFDQELVVRHWDGQKPVVLEPYGETAVRTQEDASESNNLAALPRVAEEALRELINS
jgi:hypothetical protein